MELGETEMVDPALSPVKDPMSKFTYTSDLTVMVYEALLKGLPKSSSQNNGNILLSLCRGRGRAFGWSQWYPYFSTTYTLMSKLPQPCPRNSYGGLVAITWGLGKLWCWWKKISYWTVCKAIGFINWNATMLHRLSLMIVLPRKYELRIWYRESTEWQRRYMCLGVEEGTDMCCLLR